MSGMLLRLLTTILLVAAPSAGLAETHKFKPTAGVQTFAVRPSILEIRPGDLVETQTFSRPGDYYDPQKAGPWPGEVGPFHIAGAAPGDTLVVRILKLTPNRDIAISNVTPAGISGVAGDSRTRMLNDPLPARRFVWRLDRQRMMGVLDLPYSASKHALVGFSWSLREELKPHGVGVSVVFPGFVRESGMFADWARSAWEKRDILHAGPDKVHINTRFVRYRADGSVIGAFDSIYIVTSQDGHWGIKIRSSFAP